MMELKNITLERMNNGAHYLYVSNILANAEKNSQLKTKASAQLAPSRQHSLPRMTR